MISTGATTNIGLYDFKAGLDKSDSSITTWSGRSQESKNKDFVSIEDFKLNSDTSYSQTLQRAIDSNYKRIFFLDGDYNFSEQVNINKSGVLLYGGGRLLWDGTGGAGSTCILVSEGDFKVCGLKHECTSVRRAFYRPSNAAKDLSNFIFKDCSFKSGFYSVRFGLITAENPLLTKIRNIFVINCVSDAPTDVPAGHFLGSHAIGVYYIGNNVSGGRNTSSLGVTYSKDIVIVNNIENNVTPNGTGGAEASIQIEDSENANAIVSGNVCSHDIWVSGSNYVSVKSNKCKTLRVSVGNPLGYDVHHADFVDNECVNISVAKFGSSEITNTSSANFYDNTIDPQKALLIGRSVPTRAVAIEGGLYGKDFVLKRNTVISSATQYQASVVRGSILNYYSEDNDWGVGTNITSGSGGFVREVKVKNRVFGYFAYDSAAVIGSTLSADYSVAINNTWASLGNLNANLDLNGEILVPNSKYILKKTGSYLISGKVGITAPIGSTVGLRLLVNGVEISRLAFYKSTDSLTVCPISANFRLTNTAHEVELQVFSSLIPCSVIALQPLTNISITPIS